MLGLFKKKDELDKSKKFDFNFLIDQNKVHYGKIVYCERKSGQWWDESMNGQVWDGNSIEITNDCVSHNPRHETEYCIYKIDLFNFILKNGTNFELMISNMKDFIKNSDNSKRWIIHINTSKLLSITGFDFKDNIEKFVYETIKFINSNDFIELNKKRLLVKILTDFNDLNLLSNNLLKEPKDNIFYNFIIFKEDILDFHKKFGSIIELFEKDYFLKINGADFRYVGDLITIARELNNKYFECDLELKCDTSYQKGDYDNKIYLSNKFKPVIFKYKLYEKHRFDEEMFRLEKKSAIK